MASKPSILELQVFSSSSDKMSLIGLSPPSPNTPSICLSTPAGSCNKSGFSFPIGTRNGGFIFDENLSKECGSDLSGVLETVRISSALSLPSKTVTDPVPSISAGFKSLQQLIPGGLVQNHVNANQSGLPSNNCNIGNNESKSSLAIPWLHSSHVLKRHSLPSPDMHLTPGFLSPKDVWNERKSLDGMATNGMATNGVATNSNSFNFSNRSLNLAWGRKPSSNSTNSAFSSDGSISFDGDDCKTERFRQIFKTVVSKTNKIRQNKIHPEVSEAKKRKRLDSFATSSCIDETAFEVSFFSQKITLPKWLKTLKKMKAIDPLGKCWLSWLLLVSIAFVYNAVTIFLRGVFGNDNQLLSMTLGSNMWLAFDLLFDGIYLLDILLRTRIQYIEGGHYVVDKKMTTKNYTSSRNFKFDVLCLLPLDLLNRLWTDNRYATFIRLPRLLKYHSYSEFVSRFENTSSFANAFRVGKMVTYLLYMIHLNTCCYYAISQYEGLGINEWVYTASSNSNPYIRCMYRATKTLITIGNLPKPTTDIEIIFMNIDFAIGIFVFASIIGQMRDIVGAASATKERFRERMDNTMFLLNTWHIPEHVQKKVRMWYMYKWETGELIDEADILSSVPFKMQTDIAINVHMETLMKVSLFQDCDKMLLRDLMLKLRPVLFLPGDYICRKGEVGKEMYIIKSGQVHVLSGGKVLATLDAGSVFGEISLLSLAGGNRRTADVYSPGYANLFVLDKKTLEQMIVNYPEAQVVLQRKANEILQANEENGVNQKKRGKSLIVESILTADKSRTPRFFNAVLQVTRDTKLASTVLKGSMLKTVDDDVTDCSHYSQLDEEILMTDKRGIIEPNVVVHQPPAEIVEDILNTGEGQSIADDSIEQLIVGVNDHSSNIEMQQAIVGDQDGHPTTQMEQAIVGDQDGHPTTQMEQAIVGDQHGHPTTQMEQAIVGDQDGHPTPSQMEQSIAGDNAGSGHPTTQMEQAIVGDYTGSSCPTSSQTDQSIVVDNDHCTPSQIEHPIVDDSDKSGHPSTPSQMEQTIVDDSDKSGHPSTPSQMEQTIVDDSDNRGHPTPSQMEETIVVDNDKSDHPSTPSQMEQTIVDDSDKSDHPSTPSQMEQTIVVENDCSTLDLFK